MRAWFKKYWKALLLFGIELTTIVAIGLWILPTWRYVAYILVFFLVVRNICGKTKHYKCPIRCFFASVILFVSLFAIAHIDITISLVVTAFFALVLTDRFNVSDTFLFAWSKERKHAEVMNYIRNNDPNHPVIKELENLVNEQDDDSIKVVYKYIWREGRSFKMVQDVLDCDSYNVSRLSDNIAHLFAIATARHLTNDK